MRVLVSGGAGFIGGAVARALLDHQLHVVVRPSTDPERLLSLPAGCRVHRTDLADPASTAELVEHVAPHVVVHAAGSAGHATTRTQRLAAWRDDVLATASLLEALRTVPPDRLVHVCSSLVYRPSPRPLGEDAPLGPETFRGAVKLAAAVAVDHWSLDTGVPAVIVRPFSVYGTGQASTRVIPSLLGAIADGTPFAVTSDESRRDFVHIDDVARCIALAAGAGSADGRVLNLGTGTETAIPELVAIAERTTGKEVHIAPDPYPGTPPRRPHWIADPTVPAELLGWHAEISLEQGLGMLWWNR